MVSLERYKVPSEPFRALTAQYLRENEMHLEDFSARCGYNESTMRKALTRPEIRFDLADKIMCESYGPLVWQRSPFVELYWQGEVPPDTAEPIKCQNETCPEWFALPEENGPSRSGAWKQRYCTHRCRKQAWGRKQTASFERTCPNCDEVFTVSPPPVESRTHGGWTRRIYCNATCQNQMKYKRQLEQKKAA